MFKWKPSPGARFAMAFWMGWAFHIAAYVGVVLFTNDNPLWIIAAGCGLALVIIYSRNKVNFEKEFTWMMLKTGGPKKEEELTFPNRPLRPPPPPMPPVKPPRKK